MSGVDRTGPLGVGPMTGRGMGYCAGFNGFGRFVTGRGRGFGKPCLITGLVVLGALLITRKCRNS